MFDSFATENSLQTTALHLQTKNYAGVEFSHWFIIKKYRVLPKIKNNSTAVPVLFVPAVPVLKKYRGTTHLCQAVNSTNILHTKFSICAEQWAYTYLENGGSGN